MLDYLKNILVRLSIPNECHALVINAYNKIDQTDLDYFLCNYEDENVEYVAMLNNWQFINNKYKISKYLGDLLFSLLMCKKLEEIYERKGLSKELFIHTMKGISYTVIECKLVKKEWGTFVAWWYDDFFRLRRFAFNRIQLELTHFGYTYKDDKYSFNPYMRCLNFHIPRTGEGISPSIIDKSLEEGLKFFRPLFNNEVILIKCETWLFFDKTLEFLTPDSNIYKFASRFKIFKQKQDEGISELWRLFDTEINDINTLKADTSLRKKYLEHIKNGGKFGEGVGFFIA